MVKRKLGIATILTTFLLVVGPALMWITVRYQRVGFEKLDEHFVSLRAGESSFSQAEELLRHYKSSATVERGECVPSSCSFRVELKNVLVRRTSDPQRPYVLSQHWLRYFGIRPALVVALVTVKNGTVNEVRFAAGYEDNDGRWIFGEWDSVLALSQGMKCENAALKHNASYFVNRGRTATGYMPGQFVLATFQTDATDAQKRRFQYFKFECMTTVARCASLSSGALEFMPKLRDEMDENNILRHVDPEKYSVEINNCLKSSSSPDMEPGNTSGLGKTGDGKPRGPETRGQEAAKK